MASDCLALRVSLISLLCPVLVSFQTLQDTTATRKTSFLSQTVSSIPRTIGKSRSYIYKRQDTSPHSGASVLDAGGRRWHDGHSGNTWIRSVLYPAGCCHCGS